MEIVDFTEGTLTLKGEEIAIKNCNMRQMDLKFYPDNPRIYSFVYAGDDQLSQDDIESRLSDLDHVKQLVQSIKANGGLLDPIIVKEGENIVLEGNSRLAAYRILCREDPIKWGMIKCILLPGDISDDHVFALLGEYHIIGRKDWAPFEQAGYLWRRLNIHGIPPVKISKEIGLSVKAINHLINVYSFMKKYEEVDVQRWSYFDEYIKSKKIQRARKYYAKLDDVVVDRIRNGDIPKASDVRDKLSKIAAAGGKILGRFVRTSDSLDECYERAIHGGITNVIYNRLKRFREQITDPEIKRELLKMPNVQKNKCKYEINKIKKVIDKLYEKLFGTQK